MTASLALACAFSGEAYTINAVHPNGLAPASGYNREARNHHYASYHHYSSN
jgi:hypothetical protein